MRKGGESKIFFCYRRGSGASPHSFRERGGVILCVWSALDDYANGGRFGG